jgi:phenylpyruvate tautomerase PptA (4-oxalocrotonate tautomerase family)
LLQRYAVPHLTIHAFEDDLAGRETALAGALTDSVAEVYGDWARPLVSLHLVGVPRGRWWLGGTPLETLPPTVTFGIREAAFARPDAHELSARLIASVTDAIASVFGEQSRAGIAVELVATPARRTGVGGVLAD